VRTEEGLAELYVVVGTNGALELAPRPIADPLGEELAGRFQLCRRVGDRAEVCPELDRIVSGIGRVLDEGAVLFVDYGHEASALAEPRHAAGTLVAYHRHRVEHDLLARPGRQDLTAHVNWSHLDVAARDHCLDAAGRVTQDRLLLALGLLDDPVFGDAGRKASSETLRQRLAAKRLIMPGEGGGRRFEVAAYVRGIGRDLSGFRPPESWSPPGP
ncbi:MAG: SAM-dependent methyltransferase, partial [Acidobacteriota bacterium]|nr:SAM-dependent methyltransferase [Acidobacteriota bacterium]